jgi:hypothetical protein
LITVVGGMTLNHAAYQLLDGIGVLNQAMAET